MPGSMAKPSTCLALAGSDKSFGREIANLVGDLKALAPQPAAAGGAHQ